eukprot:COSAG01_NODE_225_length_21277_cov_71.340023_18_plen_142_part_00
MPRPPTGAISCGKRSRSAPLRAAGQAPPPPVPAVVCASVRSCEALEWSLDSAADVVCGASTAVGCFSTLTWPSASEECASKGARLCTLDELRLKEGAGSGCKLDNQRTWTLDATGCAQGQHTSAAGKAWFWRASPASPPRY